MDFKNIDEGHEQGEEKLVFHYNREERLKRAPEIVKDYYEGNFKAYKPGIFRALVSTKGNRLMFITLLLCFAIVIFLGFFNRKDESVLNSIPLNLSAFSFEENVYVSLAFDEVKKQGKSKEFGQAKDIQVEFDFLDADKVALEKKVLALSYEGAKTFLRTTFHDYDIFYVRAYVFMDGLTVELTATVEKR